MTRDELRLRTYDAAGNVSAGRVRRALELVEKERRVQGRTLRDFDIPEVVKRAAALSDPDVPDVTVDDSGTKVARLGRSEASQLATADALSVFQGAVEAVRENAFRTGSAPFRSLRQAAGWLHRTLEKEARSQSHRPGVPPRRLVRILGALQRLSGGTRWRLSEVSTYLVFKGPGARIVTRIKLHPQSSLLSLATGAQEIAAASGFPVDEVTRWILTGTRPALPTGFVEVRVETHSMPDGRAATRYSGVVRLNVQYVGEREFRQIYQQLRRASGVAGRKSLGERDRKLVDAVRRLGAPPSPCDSEYFAKLARLAGRPSWRAAMVAYQRLGEKGVRFLSVPKVFRTVPSTS